MIEKERLHPDDQACWHGWISYICGKWEIARRYKPETILEIGVRTGYSAWAFLQASPDAEYIGVDNYSYGNYPVWAQTNLLGPYNACVIRADTQLLPTMGRGCTLNGRESFDFIHVDGDHSENGVMHDLDLAFSLLSKKGAILVDDYHRISEVKRGIDRWLKVHPELAWQVCPSFTGDVVIGNLEPLRATFSRVEARQETDGTKKEQQTLLVFHHGLGDLLLFLPLFDYLNRNKEYVLALQKGCNFTSLAPGSVETPGGEFDYSEFCNSSGYSRYKIVEFGMSEGSGITKTDYCAKNEFGLDEKERARVQESQNAQVASSEKRSDSKVVGINFSSTCLPGQVNPTYEQAKLVWDTIKSLGYIPLEILVEHTFHNPINKKYDFVDNSTRGFSAEPEMVKQALSMCSSFIGVLSGPWVMAVLELGLENQLPLLKAFKTTDYFEKEPSSICSLKGSNAEIKKSVIDFFAKRKCCGE